MRLKKNDLVQVISGDDKGKEGKVIKAFPEERRVLVQGIKMVWKHMKRSSQYPHGARIQKEAPVKTSAVMLVCTNCHKRTRVNYQVLAGDKRRICKKCKQPISEK